MPISDNNPTSKRFLLALLLFSLPFFMLIRWDASAWLSTTLDSAIQSAGLELRYDHVAFSGLGLHFDGLRASQGKQFSISLEQLDVSLSVTSLFSGVLAADIDAVWLANPVSFTIAQDGQHIVVSNLDAHIDLPNLFELQQQLPLRASGVVQLEGDITFQQPTMLPHTAELNIHWKQAAAGLTSPEFELGDYHIHIANAENEDQTTLEAWQWDISGGSAVGLEGKGGLSVLPSNLQQSSIHGAVDIRVDPSNATLAMMIQAFTGASQAKIRISGTLAAPRTNVIR